MKIRIFEGNFEMLYSKLRIVKVLREELDVLEKKARVIQSSYDANEGMEKKVKKSENFNRQISELKLMFEKEKNFCEKELQRLNCDDCLLNSIKKYYFENTSAIAACKNTFATADNFVRTVRNFCRK